jgi:hypothetical protein
VIRNHYREELPVAVVTAEQTDPTLAEDLPLLSSPEVARFVAQGALVFEALVPDEINTDAVATLEQGAPPVRYGASIPEAFPPGTLGAALIGLPRVAGALTSLLGPGPQVDHHAVHVRPPHGGESQPLHADAIIDARRDAFDVQLMYYPRDVTLEMGGTLSVPGTHLRQINESDIGRYHNMRGQTRLTCPAGTVVLLHHGIWHGGRRNDSDTPRYMYKIRFNPTVQQRRCWDISDLDDPRVVEELNAHQPWMEQASGRLEIHNRVLLWRELSGDPNFDIDYWVHRVTNRPGALEEA